MTDEKASETIYKLAETTIHSCCGCSCHVCDNGHTLGLHTTECCDLFWSTIESDRRINGAS